MLEFNEKYVFHIPCFKYKNDELIAINKENIIKDLVNQFNKHEYTSMYMTNVKGFYKSRCFDELLITIFTSKDSQQESPEVIFKQWFKSNNKILEQEAIAYEHNNKMIIEELD